MNLIRNTLLTVLLFQFLGFLYVKLFHTKKSPKKEHLIVLQHIKKVKLPISTEYTDNLKIASIKTEVLKDFVEPKSSSPNKTKQKPSLPNPTKTIITKIPISPSKKIKPKKIKKEIRIAKVIKAKPVKKTRSKPIIKLYKKTKPKIKLTTKIEKYAKKMLGKKYVWGATGPKCYDCSGFTQRVYRKVAGVKLPRVSYLQAKIGKRISFKKLKQGDMVFFDTEKKRTGRVNHVGIYLGKGNFIHASSGGKKVMITNFRKKRFYKNRFLWGQRVIHEKRTITTKNSLKKLASKG